MRDEFLSWGVTLVAFTLVAALLLRAHFWIPTLHFALYAGGI